MASDTDALQLWIGATRSEVAEPTVERAGDRVSVGEMEQVNHCWRDATAVSLRFPVGVTN
jgi:hypothetical protein